MTDLPLAIIAGISLGAYRRAKTPMHRCGWRVQVIPSEYDNRHDIKAIWKKAMGVMDEAQCDGVHIFLAHDRDRHSKRSTFTELKERSYRAVWLPLELCRRYGQPIFAEAFDEMLEFEEQWRASIRPDVASPLLLPETAFEAARHSSEIWKRAQTVHRQHDKICHVAKVISRFRREHRKGEHWIDKQRLAFSHGPHHASHVSAWRKRKLTFGIPTGFHFDVRHEKSRPFKLRNQDRIPNDYNEYTNVDPHGYVRGGR